MTIGNALKFIHQGQTDAALRQKFNQANDPSEIRKILENENLLFSEHDFDEAFHHQLTQCGEEEQADRLREFKMWWTLISASAENGGCGDQCKGCC